MTTAIIAPKPNPEFVTVSLISELLSVVPDCANNKLEKLTIVQLPVYSSSYQLIYIIFFIIQISHPVCPEFPKGADNCSNPCFS